ncbi:MAG: aminopeptidase [Erysipelotrichaceae bacterium]|nr:aminopeptidase [Erysipelotrichaceae bacterium]MDD3809840.1 aminopeptidase [Erysipelotrichaceae bacterium]
MFKENLQKYARLLVESGLNVQEGQVVAVMATIEAVELVREVTKAAYNRKAKEVRVLYDDEFVTRQKYLNSPLEVFESVPKYISEFRNELVEQDSCILFLRGDDPELLKGCDREKVAANTKNMMLALKPFNDKRDNMELSWCIGAVPSAAWANKVYPDMATHEAIEALWQAIFKVTYTTKDDPVAFYSQNKINFENRVKYLNDLKIESLHYRNSLGTDLVVELPEKYLFAGGGSYLSNGVYNFPNIPTEEVFTVNKKHGVNGIVYSSMPLNYHGNLIEDFSFKFEDGKIVEAKARVNEAVLNDMISLDEGACYLGEVALVPYDSPISNLNTLFYMTLLDENASCHFAIGNSYIECLDGGLTMSEEEKKAQDVNESLTHVDFMVGTSDLEIIATTRDNKKVLIFKDGNFV